MSLIFLLLITIIGTSFLIIAFYFSGYLFGEVEQFLNREYAANIALEIQPLLKEGFSVERIKNAIHYMMVLNPMVEIYILDDQGNILVYFTHPDDKIVRRNINLIPVKTFLNNNKQTLILGDDPKNPSRQKPFSASPLKMGETDGYIYIILGGQEYDKSLQSIQTGYYAKAALIVFSLTLLITLITGFLLFFLLTNRLRMLNKAMTSFDPDVPFKPVMISGKDEISSIGLTFNKMASSIKEGIKKLKDAEQMRKELISNISHDLRSPLTSIMGYVETMIRKEPELTSEKRQEFLGIILRNLTGFRKLVKGLFDIVMLENRQIQPDKEVFSIPELIQDIILKYKTQADESHIHLSFDAPHNFPLISADIGMIERVVSNLIENSLRFTPEKGYIKITLTVMGEKVQIAVSDSGCGITPEELPNIFNRYYHANKNSSGKTGLGLAIAKQILQLHGGSLKAESQLHKGSTFYIILPLS